MSEPKDRDGATLFLGKLFAVVAIVAAVWWLSSSGLLFGQASSAAQPTKRPKLSDVAKQNGGATPQKKLHPVTIRPGRPAPAVRLNQYIHGEGSPGDSGNESVTSVACGVCHASRKPNTENRKASDLDEFHQGLRFSHNSLSCLTCHDEKDYDKLHLADGTPIEYTDVMTLCAQCHGPTYRDYLHGAHGGMTGYWDLSRGPRQRNNCVDCHHPHTPQFPKMQPTFKPQDRNLDKVNQQEPSDHE